ncbi:MAG: cystine ABC transporter substrate-binding protein [Rickettsiales bacterium]|nr:MAG: cystine ABC transporter substrate-binding protein [Rickettsiales bacterium]
MKRKVVLLSLLCLVSLVLSMFVSCKKTEKVEEKVGELKEPAIVGATDGSYPPFGVVNENGDLEGFEVDVLRAIGEKLGRKVEILNMEYPGALVGLTTGKVDMIVTVDESDVKKDKVFLSQPIMSCGYTAVINKENTTITSEDYLLQNEVKIGAIQGTGAAEEAEKRYGEKKIVYFDGGEIMYESLAQNKIDAVVNDSVVNAYFMSKSKRANELKILSEEFTVASGVSAISKANPELAEEILQAIVDLEKEGKMEEIRKRWDFHL